MAKKLTARQRNRAYEKVIQANYEECVRLFGKERADKANIGYGDSGDNFCSKVYSLIGEEADYVSTDYDPETFAILGHSCD